MSQAEFPEMDTVLQVPEMAPMTSLEERLEMPAAQLEAALSELARFSRLSLESVKTLLQQWFHLPGQHWSRPMLQRLLQTELEKAVRQADPEGPLADLGLALQHHAPELMI